MTPLDAVLDDLRAGLRNRAIRKRRARAAATGGATAVLLAAALAGGLGVQSNSSALASASGSNDAALMLRGCQLLNLPKTAQGSPNTCVVP